MIKLFKLKSSILVLFIMSLVIFSCGDDEGSPGESKGGLVGTWIFQVYELQNCDEESSNWSFTEDCTEDDCQKFVFKADGTLTEIDIDSDTTETSGSYEVHENEITLCGADAFVDEENCATFSFIISGNELQLTGEPDSGTSATGCDAVITLIKE